MRLQHSMRGVMIVFHLFCLTTLALTHTRDSEEASWPDRLRVFIRGSPFGHSHEHFKLPPPLPPLPKAFPPLPSHRSNPFLPGAVAGTKFGGLGVNGLPGTKTIPGARLVASAAAPTATSCEFELNGEKYDLRPLVVKTGDQEYIGQDTAKNIYKINICNVAVTADSVCMREGGMVCQYTSPPSMSFEGVIMRWGAAPYPEWGFLDPNNPDAGIKLTAQNGDDCASLGHKPRISSIFLPCDPSADHPRQASVQEISVCNYAFTIPTKYSCRGMAGVSAGWVFITWFVVLAVVYIVLGCLYNKFLAKEEEPKTCLRLMPNYTFWAELPSLVVDGCRYSFNIASCYALKVKGPPKDDL